MPNISGLTVYAARVASGLANNGNELTIVTSRHNKNLPLHENINGIKIIRIPVTFFVSKGPVMLTYPFRIIKPVVTNDVINCHLPQFEGFMVALLGRLFGKRIIVTYQCDMMHGESLGQKIVSSALTFSHRITMMLADSVIVLSNDYAKHSAFLSRYKEKIISVLPPIVLTPENKKYKDLIRKKIKSKHTIIGYIGRLSHEKGVEYLLESIDYLEKTLDRKFIILLAGPKRPIGEESYLQRMELLFKKYSTNVVFLGTIPDGALVTFYKSLDVLVLPSINSLEAFGMVQAEAMMCGTPVVASDLPGVRTPILLTGMGKLVKPKKPKEIASAVLQIVKNRDRFTRSKKQLDHLFSYNQTIQSYEQILRHKKPL